MYRVPGDTSQRPFAGLEYRNFDCRRYELSTTFFIIGKRGLEINGLGICPTQWNLHGISVMRYFYVIGSLYNVHQVSFVIECQRHNV